MGCLYGDITSDGRDIILLGAGTTDWENQEIVDNLRHITPQLRKAPVPGAILVPATWATVVQVARTFEAIPHIPWTPAPGLQRWIMAEVMRRGAAVASVARPETGRQPMPHQLAGGFAIAMNGRFFLADEMGPQPVTTPVLTPGGWTQLGKLSPGDHVYDRFGNPAAVTGVKHFGMQPVYRVTFSDRTSTLATAGHRWRAWTATDRHRKDRPDGRVLTTEALLRAGLRRMASRGAHAFFLPQQPVIRAGRPASAFPLDPYAYGALLGDGPGLAQGKHVHPGYLAGDQGVRRDVLRGLLDSGGTVGSGASAGFSSASRQLTADVAFLARSLGAVATEAAPQSAHYGKDGARAECQDRHRVLIRFPADGPNPFRCERKAASWARNASRAWRREPPRAFTAIEPAGTADTCCIALDTAEGNHVYLTDTALIPTHNTGKSLSALLGFAELQARGKSPFPALIVCPASVIDSWLEEVEAAFPSWTAVAYRGPKRHRLSARYQLYVMSYQAFRNDMRPESTGAVPPVLRRLRPRSLLVDEAHALTDRDTAQSKAVRDAAPGVPYFVAMSGTPVKKDVRGFWPAMYCIDPAAFPSGERYAARYALRGPSDYGGTGEARGLNPLRADEFHVVMTGTMRHVAKADVLADLPPKTYSARVVDIPAKWRTAYDEMQADMLAHLPDSDDAVLPVMSTLTQLMRLQQLASSACDVTITTEWDEGKGEEKEVVSVFMKEPSWKVDELMAILDDHDGSPVVTFAPHRQLIDLAGARAAAAGYRTGYIVGGQAAGTRRDTRHAFQRGEIDLLCVTTDAGGVGLTLTAAYTAVFLERPWAYWQAAQAEDRLHRRGQEARVHIIDVIARDTVEARVRKAIQSKAKSLSELVRDPRIVREVLGGLPASPGKRAP